MPVNPNLISVCGDEPIVNLSTEDPDVDRYIGLGWPVPPPPSICHVLGTCGHIYFSWGCLGLCYSTVSQEDANQCAINQGMECIGDDTGCVSDCGTGTGTGLFQSIAQSCTIACADGGNFTYFLSAGAVLSFFNQADANKRANALACKLAQQFKLCLQVIGDTTSCTYDYMSFVVKAVGRLTQFPLESNWTISGPGIDTNLLTYPSDNNSIFGTNQIRISGTPTIAVDTYVIARITDNNTGSYMERTIPVTIETCGGEYGDIEPNITSATKVFWNSEADIPAGTYRVAYVTGAWFGPDAPGGWRVNDGGFMPDGVTPRGFHVVHSGTTSFTEVVFPSMSIYNSQGEAEAASAGLSIIINHTGGLIGMYQKDSVYSDNFPGSPNPSFKLTPI